MSAPWSADPGAAALNQTGERIAMPKPKRILAIASGGGHFVQLLRLRPAWEGQLITYATVHGASATDVAPMALLTFRDVSRADWWRLPLTVFDILVILARVRPQVIVTTGALPGLVALALAVPFGVRTLWVDSIANSEVLSGSGGQAGKVATRVLTQWPLLAQPNVEYWGSVL
jgi:UDP-N-acetylglucosamine:LPS N-acetylglucosamine transferase